MIAWIREGSYGQFYPNTTQEMQFNTTHVWNSTELEFGLTGVLLTITPEHAQTGWCRIDPGLGAAATRVPAAFRKDSHPQAILKFQPRNSFDYRAHYD